MFNEVWSNSAGEYYVRIGATHPTQRSKILQLELDKRYTIVHDNLGSDFLNYVNGKLVLSLDKLQTSKNETIGLGHRSGGGLKGKIYNVKFWDDRGLVRDFIPVLDSNNKPALYDKVEEKFYYNKGNGEDFKYKL